MSSPFFSWGLWLKIHQFLFIFSKNQFLLLFIIAIIFFTSISFISNLIFMIFSLLLALDFLCSSSSGCFWCRVILFICGFSCFLRHEWIAINFPLWICCVPWVLGHRLFIVICFYVIFIFSLISSVISWLFSSALFSLHVFVVFYSFFSPVIDI